MNDDLLYKQALELRKIGRSYNSINRELNIPKSTLSGWFSKHNWSKKISENNSKKNVSVVNANILRMNAARAIKRENEIIKTRKEAEHDFLQLKTDPLFLTGLALYWGEGSKTSNGRVSLINSDPRILEVTANFYRKILNVPEECLRIELFVYPDNDIKKVYEYWSNLLDIPIEQFIKPQLMKSKGKRSNNKLTYGICTLYFSNTQISIKILEWIKLISNEINTRE